jgi:hypothetical protein
LGKKSNKKNKFSVVSPVDVYKSEFSANIELTQLSNVLFKKNLSFSTGLVGDNLNQFNQNLLLDSGFNISSIFLQQEQSSFIKDSNINFFKKDFFFVDLFDDRLLNHNNLKKEQPVLNEERKLPKYRSLDLTKLYTTTTVDSFSNFFKKEVLDNYNSTKPIIQHPDLDDETRTLRRNFGKTTPIRVLKKPQSDFFFNNVETGSDIELFRFRFNDKNPTLASKPIKPTLYLTFKQKRYNQRVSIPKKNITYFNHDLSKTQVYSGNPFLKDNSIIEENFGNPTRQYRMLKKAKSRLDTTKVTT